MWCVGDSQDGGVRYSQSPLEPVLVNMVPPDPEAPRGTGGGEAEVEGTRGPRRRTPAGPTKPATRLHSRGRLRTAHAMLVCPPFPSGPGREVRAKRKWFASPGVSDGRGSLGKGVEWRGRSGCNSWEPHTSALAPPLALWSHQSS